MTKNKKIIQIIYRIGLLLLGALMLLLFTNTAYSIYESIQYQKPGEMIETANGKVHVYTKLIENEGPVYVFLNGFGGGSSYYDFKRLWEPLSAHSSIVTIDYLGYGMSETTTAERTIEHVVSELDEALTNAGISGPYILVSHSLGGFYAAGYSVNYPEKTEALIFLDNSLPGDVLDETESEMDVYKQMRPQLLFFKYTGLLRLMEQGETPGLTVDEQKAYTYHQNKMLLNATVMDEIDHMKTNAAYLMDRPVMDVIPELLLVSGETNRQGIEAGAEAHQQYLNAHPQSELILIEAGHYLHNEVPEQVLDAINQFVQKLH